MTLLYFVLDLPRLPRPILREVKQALWQLANYYAVTSLHNENRKESLSDRIGLCYFSSVDYFKIAYCPRESFRLRDFHNAVLYVPVKEFGSVCREIDLSIILEDQLLYSWGENGIAKKVIILSSSCVFGNINSMREVLAEATEKRVSIEFLLLEQKSEDLSSLSDDMNNFVQQIVDFENCSFNTSFTDKQALCDLVKSWLRDLKDDLGEVIGARFTFKSNLFGPVSSVFCNLSVATLHIADDYAPCQTCRCHGRPVDHKSPSCPVTGTALRGADLIETSVMIGENTILFLPSYHSCQSPQQASQPIKFEIFERTRLASFSKGVIMGAAYYVTPSACHDIASSIDDSDKSDLNSQVFHGLRSKLKSLDQGLICSSVCNVEKLKEAAFNCYYLLLPSENGAMLLRRIAGSEEILPINESIDQTTTKEIEDSIDVSLEKMQLNDYNPVLLERGFHQKLNSLVQESLDIGQVRNELYDFIYNVAENVSSKDSKQMVSAVHGYQTGMIRFLQFERRVMYIIHSGYYTQALSVYCKSLSKLKGRGEGNFIDQVRQLLIYSDCAGYYVRWLELLISYRQNVISFDDLREEAAQLILPTETSVWEDFDMNIKDINMYTEEEIEVEISYLDDKSEDDEDMY